jgi:capsular polysaccharide biosynthesis protein
MSMADVYRALWRHKWFVLILTGILAAATWVLTSRQQKTYEASTLVRVQQVVQDPTDPGQTVTALEASQRLALTYARIVKTSAIAERVRRGLHSTVPAGEIDLSAEAVPDLDLVTISAKSPSPRLAQRIANAVPTALKDFIDDTGTLRDQVITIEAASRPTDPVSPRPKLNVALALLFGLVFNGALALLLEVLADRLPGPDELERLTGRPILTTIPTVRFRRSGSRLTARRPPQTKGTIVVAAESLPPPRSDPDDSVTVPEVRRG